MNRSIQLAKEKVARRNAVEQELAKKFPSCEGGVGNNPDWLKRSQEMAKAEFEARPAEFQNLPLIKAYQESK